MSGTADRHHSPDAFLAEQLKFNRAGLAYELVVEDLARQVVTEASAVALLRALAVRGDLLLVCDLYAEAAGLEEAVFPQLLGDSFEHGSAQLLGVNRSFLGDAAAAVYVSAAEVA